MPAEPQQQYPKIYLYRRIVQAKLFIDRHFAEGINLDAIANEAFFSRYHFIRLFKAAYGKTPHQYLIAVRIEQSRLMLISGLPVAAVCYAVGFNSITSFSSLFKKIHGRAPLAYQQIQLRRLAEMRETPVKFIPNCFLEKKTAV